jgi:amino acid adenylation domain-containing protein
MQESLTHQSLPKIQIESIYPLSPMQQGMLFHTLQASESGAYFVQSVFTLHGRLNTAAFEQAWRRVVERHPILRTLFKWENNKEPLQIVCKAVKLPWINHDWRSLTVTSQQERLDSLLQTERTKGFELDKAPLMRCALIQVADDTYQFVWSHHHLLLDGWCLSIILEEIFAFHEAFSRGDDLYLKAPPPYRNYINWLRQQDSSISEKFWRKTLQGFSTPTSLNVDKSRRNVPNLKQTYDQEEVRLSAIATDTLKSLARQHHLTVNTVIQGAWALLLSRYSGESDVVFGATVSGRPPDLAGVESMVGLFINTLPMRVQLLETAQVLPWLKQLQAQHIDQNQHSYSSLTDIQGWSSVPRGTPLFESILVLENYPDVSSLSEGKKSLQIKTIESFERTNYPLTVVVVPDQELLIQISYDTNRFDTETIVRMLGHFQTLLESIVANPDQKISELPILTEPERHQLLVEWNNTKTEYPQDKCIHQLFEEQVEQSPDAIAVIFENQQLTYRELNTRANQLAHYLQTLGVGPEVLVGICLERSLEMIVGILGILKAGGAYVPLDPAYPQERLAFMLEDATVPVLLTQVSLVEKVSAPQLRVVYLDKDREEIAQQPQENLANRATVENLAYIIYTSGSTGNSKGVAIEHHSTIALVVWAKRIFNSEDLAGVLAATSICFDLSVFELFVPLSWGGKVILIQNALSLPTLSTATKVTLINTVPSVLSELLQLQELLTSVRTINLAGEPLQSKLVQKIYQQDAVRQVFNLYGPSEDTTYSTYALVKKQDKAITIGCPIDNTQVYILDSHLQPVPIGVSGELHIGGDGLARGYLNRPELTAEKFIPNPFSDEPGSRLYKTGDLARYLPDGNIEFLGRIDHQVKIRGFRIELGEVETALSQHSNVREAIVTVREDVPGDKRLVAYITSNLMPDRLPYQSECLLEINGNTLKLRTEDISNSGIGLVDAPAMTEHTPVRLHLLLPEANEAQWFEGKVAWSRSSSVGIQLHLTPTEQTLLDQSITYLLETQGLWKIWQRTIAQSLRQYLKGKLPDYMIPSAFVLMQNLPLTPNGKIDRRALPAPDRAHNQQEEHFAAPRTPTEVAIAAIWAEVLEFQSVAIHDNFFELGGHSLLAVQIISRIRAAFAIDLPLSCLFESPTIAGLSQAIASIQERQIGDRPAALPAIAIAPRNQSLPLSFTQYDLWYAEHHTAHNFAGNSPRILKIVGTLSPSILEQSLNEIVRRHEILRTTFPIVEGQPIQQILPNLTVPLSVIDLQHLRSERKAAEATEIFLKEMCYRFDLTVTPPLKTILVKLSDEEHWLLILMHHIITDGWSHNILLEELEILYSSFLAGQSSPLPALPFQYADFAVWQRNYFTKEILATHMPYWEQHLADLPTSLDLLPVIQPAQANHAAPSYQVALSEALTREIASLSQAHGVTPFMVLLTALNILLYQWSHQTDIVVLSAMANRTIPDIEKLLGSFISDLPLRAQLDPHQTGIALLQQIKQTVSAALTHTIPSEKIWEPFEDKIEVFRTVNFVLVPSTKTSNQALTFDTLLLDCDRGVWNEQYIPLELYVSYPAEADHAIKLFASYSITTFTHETIALFISHYQAILQTLVKSPQTLLCEFSKIPRNISD